MSERAVCSARFSAFLRRQSAYYEPNDAPPTGSWDTTVMIPSPDHPDLRAARKNLKAVKKKLAQP